MPADIDTFPSTKARDWIIKTVTGAPVTTLSFGAADGLKNGDAAVAYDFIASVVFNSGVCAILLQPNGISTNMRSVTATSVNGAAFANGPNADSRVAITTAAGFATTFQGKLWAARGTGARRGMSHSSEHTAAASLNESLFTVAWNEDATLITSIDFTSSIANGIGIGSSFMIRPLVL